MKIAILTANLGEFDENVNPVEQYSPKDGEVRFHRFTYENFPKIADWPPRLQYRLPKMFGWQMFPGYDYYVWLDGSMTLPKPDSTKWLVESLADGDIGLFKHPWRNSAKEETDFIEERLTRPGGDKYLTPRYANGLHKEQLADIQLDTNYVDDKLYASMAFVYRDSERVRDALRLWWLHTSRYYTVDQIVLPYLVKALDVRVLPGSPFKNEYIELASAHK